MDAKSVTLQYGNRGNRGRALLALAWPKTLAFSILDDTCTKLGMIERLRLRRQWRPTSNVVRDLFRHHNHGSIEVTADDFRHDGRVDNAKIVERVNQAVFVGHGKIRRRPMRALQQG